MGLAFNVLVQPCVREMKSAGRSRTKRINCIAILVRPESHNFYRSSLVKSLKGTRNRSLQPHGASPISTRNSIPYLPIHKHSQKVTKKEYKPFLCHKATTSRGSKDRSVPSLTPKSRRQLTGPHIRVNIWFNPCHMIECSILCAISCGSGIKSSSRFSRRIQLWISSNYE